MAASHDAFARVHGPWARTLQNRPNLVTHLRDTLYSVAKDVRNVTLSLPELLLKRLRIYAAAQDRSMTAVMAEAVEKFIDEDSSYKRAQDRALRRLKNAGDLGTGGRIGWAREELHER